MIYLDKELVYPSNTVINDAACRSSYTADAYSPITNEIYDVLEEFRKRRSDAFDFIKDETRIMETLNFKDVEYDKMKNKQYIIEDDGSYISDHEIKMFEGDMITDIVKYFINAWNTWQYRQEMNKQDSGNVTYGAVRLHDNSESDMLVLLDDLEVNDEFEEEYNENEIIENVQKLVYYLKLLQEISSIKGYSAIQTIILIDRFGGNRSLIANSGLYRVDSRGRIIGTYSSSCNTSASFIEWMNICSGNPTTPEAARWYNIICKFKDICNRLNINLANEEPSNYLPDYVNKQVVTYLVSNEEYIDTVGRIDKNVLALLEPDKLFTVRNASMCYDDSFTNVVGLDKVVLRFQDVYNELEALVEYTNRITTNKMYAVNIRIKELYDPKEGFVEKLMLFLLKNVMGITDSREAMLYYRSHYYFHNDNILWFDKKDADDVIFKVKTTTLARFFKFPSSQECTCYLTISGAAIFYDYGRQSVSYVMLEDLMNGKAEIKDL